MTEISKAQEKKEKAVIMHTLRGLIYGYPLCCVIAFPRRFIDSKLGKDIDYGTGFMPYTLRPKDETTLPVTAPNYWMLCKKERHEI